MSVRCYYNLQGKNDPEFAGIVRRENPSYDRLRLAPEMVESVAGRKILDVYFANTMEQLERQYADVCAVFSGLKSEFMRG